MRCLGVGSVFCGIAAEQWHPRAVHNLAIDLIAAYTKGGSDNLGSARVVYDKFYVIQNEVETCD